MLWSDLPPTDETGKALKAVLVPLGTLALIGALDLLLPGPTTLMALLVAVPATAMLCPGGPRLFAGIGLATLGVAAPLGASHWAERPVAVTTSLLGTAVTTAMIGVACRRHERGVSVQAGLRRVAEAAQRAVLRPVPRRVGPVEAGERYLAADAQACVGGDLYGIVETPYGVRVIMGDAMGKGLAAVDRAADVLGAFRGLAWHEMTLAGVAARLDAFLAAQGHDEEFVTAVLVEIPLAGGTARVVNCGHPPPLVLSDGVVTFAEMSGVACSPPLGLHGMFGGPLPDDVLFEVPFVPGDRLLLYTDGVSEARDAGDRFYPLAERAATLGDGDPDVLLADLEADMRAHVGGRFRDDAALLLIRLNPEPAARSSPGAYASGTQPPQEPADRAEGGRVGPNWGPLGPGPPREGPSVNGAQGTHSQETGSRGTGSSGAEREGAGSPGAGSAKRGARRGCEGDGEA